MKRPLLPSLLLLAAILCLPATATANLLLASSAQFIGGEWEDNFHHDGSQALGQLGYYIGTGGDVNADGTPDYIASSPFLDHAGAKTGGAYVYSGADNSLLYSFFGTPNSYFGDSATICGDINADGHDDILVGAPRFQVGGQWNGRIYVYSGADGSELMQLTATAEVWFGSEVCGAGDIDLDGYDDFLVCSLWGGPAFEGEVQMISGATGLVMATATGDSWNGMFGAAMANVGDVTGDGINDFAVGSPESKNQGYQGAGDIDLLSGADLSVIWRKEGTIPFGYLGYSVAAIPDLNQDGTPDVLVGNPNYGVEVLSGVDGALLLMIYDTEFSRFGWSVANAGDLDGDFIPEILVGAPFADGPYESGKVHIHSGLDGSLIRTEYEYLPVKHSGWKVANIEGGATLSSRMLMYSSPNDTDQIFGAGSITGFGFNTFLSAPSGELSQSAGGSITYELDFPDHAAGDTYQLLASAHGTGPMQFPNGLLVPLSLDSMLVQTYLGDLPPIIQNGVGVLDSEGKGTIQLTAPAGAIPASLIGVEYSLAAACRYGLDLWRYTSVALAITITP